MRALFLLLFICSALSTSIIVAMAEWFVGPIMDKIINACSDYLEEQVGWQTGMKKELQRLRENHPKIQAVVFAANQAQISDQNPALNIWIWQLRDAIDEADDVLDEFECMKHKEQLPKNTEEEKKRKLTSFLFESPREILKIGERVLKRDPNLKRLEEAVQKLDKVSADVATFLHLLDSVKQEQKEQEIDFYKRRETGYLPKNDLIGRRKEKELVVQWLRKPSNEHRGTDLYRNISLLSIVGHGGMGKTTLLQHVYKDDEITKEFDLKMWVCVSNNFDVKKVIADMLECLKKERPRWETLVALQGRLEEEVMYKKFLLVLDDIWEEEEERDRSKWENVFAPLASRAFGSKILVTTRTDSVALMFANLIKKKKEIIKLKGLEKDECLQLLNSHAFSGVENPNDHENLRVIARDIVKKFSSSPLAAKVIGGVLNSLDLDERRWRTVLESNLLGQTSVDSILRLSYIVLPNPLKSCFAFCGMFAQDHKFDKEDLIRMWIALGFIQPSLDQEETMEDIGGRYFDVLAKKSFFDKFDKGYKMHDLLHKLAQSVFKQECLRVEDSTKLPSKIPETLRHLSIKTTNLDILRQIEKFKHLHSLFLFYEGSNQDLCGALIKIFKASRCLRLLYIHTHELEMIPEEIGYLKHLRYLDIRRIDVTGLPRSLSNLYHLQYIIYEGWVKSSRLGRLEVDDVLPIDIKSFSNLRLVTLLGHCFSSVRGIGKLNFLDELEMFDLRDEMGYRIDELKYLNYLCKLGINCLENLKDAEEARNAQLCEKRRLADLTLCWSDTDSRNIDLNQNVLDNLQPPKCLRNLSIKRYMGARSAIWMNNVNLLSSIQKIEEIELSDCMEWETLPPSGQLPFLKSLRLSNMPKVKWLESKFNGNDKYRAFPLLEVLYIWGLEALEDWFEAGIAAEDGCLFPCLIELTLSHCPKLKELPSLPSKLMRLQINKIRWTTLNFCSNSNPIPLEILLVLFCPNITSLPLADEAARLAGLRFLAILNCPNLVSLGRHREVEATNNCHLMVRNLWISDPSVLLMEPLTSIASVKTLFITDNDELVSFPNEAEQWLMKFRSSLYELQFERLKSLQSLPSSLESFSSLQKLCIQHVPMLRELPNLPSSLESLSIAGCHPELYELYRGDGGSDRHKIAHIPYIDIPP
ncbi:Putative disease resistance protein RGA4 [Dendrobium catenatum]|uniref:Disease resistance protein RGA4 n=2 Tax=Dendrobium catenatum TaxID=906689 RepID=A0A2I0WSW7_9ASPA|nr:Putative disease resistance protein RGA4 [Dendrobium catenatum]